MSKYDAKETASWLKENPWTFPILCDGREVIERYGLLNEKALDRPERAGIPHPTTIIIDTEGFIRFKETWTDFRKRTSPATIIRELDKLND
jgi:peroxiredoxin